jgi:integrase
MTGIRRRHGTVPTQKAPVVDQELGALLATLDGSLRGLRDRALLTMGWFGAFRRSELVALTVADVKKEREGLVVAVRRSKGDQEGRGAEKGIPYASSPALCPVRALEAWLEAASITEGAIFRGVDRHGRVAGEGLSGRTVARIVQGTAEKAGLDPKAFAGTRFERGSRRRLPRRARASMPSCDRLSAGARKSHAATSAMRSSSMTTQRSVSAKSAPPARAPSEERCAIPAAWVDCDQPRARGDA